jgi:ABC-2 type transport system ATP-binding protein
MSEPAIEVRGLCRSFGPRRAVDGLSFAVAPGEVFGFLGPNGAGKTTTVRLLTGLLRPTSGEVRVLGLDPLTDSLALRSRIGVVFEEPGHYERLPVRANLAFFARLYGAPRARVQVLLEQMGLAGRAGDPVYRLSRGLRQKLALARALVGSPSLLFLDEPTSGLDPRAAREVRALIRAFCQDGGTVFLTTHLMEEAEELCRRVAILDAGRLVALGAPGDLALQHAPGAGRGLEEVFLRLTGRSLAEAVERTVSREGS